MPEVNAVEEAVEDQIAAYSEDTREDRPILGYAWLLGIYAGAVATIAFFGRRRLPGQLRPADLAVGAVSTYKLARVLTKDPVTSPLRVPFTRFEGRSGPAELEEETRGTGWRHAVGELLSCPFCIAQWVATSLTVGLVVAPKATRTLMSVLVMVTASDVMQLAYSKAEQSVEGNND